MKSLISLALCLAALTCGTAGCRQIDVTVLTQAPPGRTAFVDVGDADLGIPPVITLSRGLAIALECTEWDDAYAGPCRDMSVAVDDAELAEVLPVHLDAFAGDVVSSRSGDYSDTTRVSGPADRAGALVAATNEGETPLTVSAASGAVTLTLVVEAVPADEPDALPAEE